MSWLSKILPPRVNQQEGKAKSNIPEGLWIKCNNCNEILYHTELEENLNICPKCSYHHTLSARERLKSLFDENLNVEDIEEVGNATNISSDDSNKDIASNIIPLDFLNFKDSKFYSDRLLDIQKKTAETDALIVQSGLIGGMLSVVASFEFAFIGGSMGCVVGERFVRAVYKAIELKCPFICFASSGGARMQEGVLSLMQMTKTCAALTLLSDNAIPFISVLTNPTMGGVSASFAFLGDVVIAEPDALIGFAGPRVIEQTVREKLPDGFQRAEFLLNKGAIDMVVNRLQLKDTLINLIHLLYYKNYKKS